MWVDIKQGVRIAGRIDVDARRRGSDVDPHFWIQAELYLLTGQQLHFVVLLMLLGSYCQARFLRALLLLSQEGTCLSSTVMSFAMPLISFLVVQMPYTASILARVCDSMPYM